MIRVGVKEFTAITDLIPGCHRPDTSPETGGTIMASPMQLLLALGGCSGIDISEETATKSEDGVLKERRRPSLWKSQYQFS
jgi:uncharacterized OsmC-like protein